MIIACIAIVVVLLILLMKKFPKIGKTIIHAIGYVIDQILKGFTGTR